ncbi:MAG: glycoside hydrolase family 130 protein [Acidobacteriaceae bacterium]
MSCSLGALTLLAFSASPGAASDWQIGPFVRPQQGNPVIAPLRTSTFACPRCPGDGKPVYWEALHTFNPAAIVRNGEICVLYRAEDDSGAMQIGGHTSRLGLAISKDGIHFQRRPEPVFFPADDDQTSREWPGGVEDPRLVESSDGSYVLTYTQWNRVTYSVGIATSKDLLHWRKWGPAFQQALNGKYAAMKYKSAGIVTRLQGGRLIAAKINGQYWMYWGEGAIHLATSPDLIRWTPVVDSNGELLVVLHKRAGRFDSGFPEVGPPPVLTSKGIVLMNNGKNDPKDGDPALGPNAYAAGQALFQADDPSKLIARAKAPFLKPELPFEKTGQYAAGTTFAEGLVYFQGKWFLYYGSADSDVAVAIASGAGR